MGARRTQPFDHHRVPRADLFYDLLRRVWSAAGTTRDRDSDRRGAGGDRAGASHRPQLVAAGRRTRGAGPGQGRADAINVSQPFIARRQNLTHPNLNRARGPPAKLQPQVVRDGKSWLSHSPPLAGPSADRTQVSGHQLGHNRHGDQNADPSVRSPQGSANHMEGDRRGEQTARIAVTLRHGGSQTS